MSKELLPLPIDLEFRFEIILESAYHYFAAPSEFVFKGAYCLLRLKSH